MTRATMQQFTMQCHMFLNVLFAFDFCDKLFEVKCYVLHQGIESDFNPPSRRVGCLGFTMVKALPGDSVIVSSSLSSVPSSFRFFTRKARGIPNAEASV